MKRSTLLQARLVVLAGLLAAAVGCGSDGSEKSSTAPRSADAAPASSIPEPSTSAEAGSGAVTQVAGSAALSGGAGASHVSAGSSSAAGAATFSAIYAEILTKGATGNCMFAACHGGPPDPAVNGGLQIKAGDQPGAYKNLVDAKSSGAVCSGKTYVVPGDSAGSLLVQKLADAPPCGAKMPIGSPLTAAQVAQIARWIDEGAQDN